MHVCVPPSVYIQRGMGVEGAGEAAFTSYMQEEKKKPLHEWEEGVIAVTEKKIL